MGGGIDINGAANVWPVWSQAAYQCDNATRSDTKIKVMNYQITLLLLPLTLAVSGCAAVAVIETAVDVAATGMKLTASAAGTAIKATGAAADALIPDTKKTDPDPRISSNPN